MISDLGLAQAVISSKTPDDEVFADTVWTMQIIRGFFLWLISCVIAIPASEFLSKPEIAPLIPVCGLSLLISSFTPTKSFVLDRNMMQGTVTVIQLVSQLVATGATVSMALTLHSTWAMAIGWLVGDAVRVFLQCTWIRGRNNRLCWSIQQVVPLLHFAKWVFIATCFNFIGFQIDKLLVAKYVDSTTLGLFAVALSIAMVPNQLAGALAAKVLTPLHAKAPTADSSHNRFLHRKARFSIFFFVATISYSLAFFCPTLISLLFDERYQNASPLCSSILIANLPLIALRGATVVTLGSGDSKGWAAWMVFYAITQCIFLTIGLSLYSIQGAIFATVVSSLVSYPVYAILARNHEAWDPPLDILIVAIICLMMSTINAI